MSKGLYSFCPYVSYTNDQILKDCCLIPYTFHKYLGYRSVIVTAKGCEYTNLRLAEGLELDLQPMPENCSDRMACEEWLVTCIDYIDREYRNIDVLFGFGLYPIFPKLVREYKRLRPDGKVILKLNANTFWMDRINYENEEIAYALKNCNVVSCESKKLQKFLSERWNVKIDYITNGSVKYIETEPPRIEQKENTILTVGRIGTEQKANDIMLEAFAKASGRIPDWKMKLIGGVEPSFESYIEDYFGRYPQLRERVIFAGRQNDKYILESEYQKAKIFVLSSRVEGGTPNVWTEAARNGCYMICSDIDAVDEFIGFGSCGRKFDVGNVSQLSEIFEQVCTDKKLIADTFEKSILFNERFFDYKRAVFKLEHLMKVQG